MDKSEFMEENDEMFGKKVVMEPGDSDRVKAGQIILPVHSVISILS